MIKQKGIISDAVPLTYADKPNTFEGTAEITSEGPYEIIVYVYDSATGNTGVDRVSFVATR